jgi:bacterial/archaeal transporter family-2 protein
VEHPPSPAIAAALGAGVFGAIQPKVNAVLGERLGSGLIATLVNFAVALACALVVLGFRPSTRRHLLAIREWDVPWWTLTAGLGGALVVLSAVVTVETIGVAIFSVAFFAGQITSGLLVDRLGLGRREVLFLSRRRLAASALAITAVVLTQLGREAGDLAPEMVLLVLVAGGAAAFQAAFNGRIAAAVGDPVAPTAVNVAVGTAALAVVGMTVAAFGGLEPLDWPAEPWLYVGGALGVSIVLAIAVAASHIGVLSATLAMLAAQLIGAVGIDWAVADVAPTAGVLAGGALVVVAVALVGRRPVPRAVPPVGEL